MHLLARILGFDFVDMLQLRFDTKIIICVVTLTHKGMSKYATEFIQKPLLTDPRSIYFYENHKLESVCAWCKSRDGWYTFDWCNMFIVGSKPYGSKAAWLKERPMKRPMKRALTAASARPRAPPLPGSCLRIGPLEAKLFHSKSSPSSRTQSLCRQISRWSFFRINPPSPKEVSFSTTRCVQCGGGGCNIPWSQCGE